MGAPGDTRAANPVGSDTCDAPPDQAVGYVLGLRGEKRLTALPGKGSDPSDVSPLSSGAPLLPPAGSLRWVEWRPR